MSVKAERDKHEKDLEEVRERNLARGIVAHDAAEVHRDVVVSSADKKTGEPTVEKVGEVHAFGGKVYVEIDGTFSRDDAFVLQQTLASAFQAVA